MVLRAARVSRVLKTFGGLGVQGRMIQLYITGFTLKAEAATLKPKP